MKRTIVILAKAGAGNTEDMAFYNIMLRQDPGLLSNIATIILLPTVEQFIGYLNTLSITTSFSLLIHMGNKSMNPPQDGIDLYEDLTKLPFFEKLKIEYTSRQGESTHNGVRVLHSQKFMKNSYDINSIPINHVADLIDITSNGVSCNEKVDFAILTALYKDEHQVFKDNLLFDEADEQSPLKKGVFKDLKEFESNSQILIAWQKRMGAIDAAAYTSKIISSYNPKFLILGGVCGGLEESVKKFDIIIPEIINDYVSGKIDKGVFKPEPIPAKIDEDLKGYLLEKESTIKENMRQIAPTYYLRIIDEGFKIHFKDMACGPWVIKTDGILEEIANSINANIKGLEMESLGVVRASNIFNQYGKYGLVVKSVMDYTDENKTDGGNFGEIKHHASFMSYLCIRAMMPVLLKFKDPKIPSGKNN